MTISYSSPGITVVERDFSLTIPAPGVTVVGGVGAFSWGACNEALYISNEADLQQTVGKPVPENAKYYVEAVNVLTYTNNLTLVRAIDTATAKNASCDDSRTGVLVENRKALDTLSSSALDGMRWVAKYPGAIGSSLSVSLCDANTFEHWEYAYLFPTAPATSPYAAKAGAELDEIHAVVIDQSGVFTGVPGTILETYEFLSKARDGKSLDLNPTYFVNKINEESDYVYFASMPISSEYETGGNYTNNTTDWGKPLIDPATGKASKYKALKVPEHGKDGSTNPSATNPHSGYGGRLGGGNNGAELDAQDILKAWDVFRNSEETASDILYIGAFPDDHQMTIAQHVLDKIVTVRQDCVLIVSPKLKDVLNKTGDEATKAVIKYSTDFNRPDSYGIMSCNWMLVYEQHTDATYWIPDASGIAGIMARTDETHEPWYSPAGYNRGIFKNVIKLAWNPSEQDADKFYPYSVNRVFTSRSNGTVLFGDRTMLRRPSMLRQIHVRRLLIQLKRLISDASKYTLFEFNDTATQRRFKALVEPYLQQVQAARGLDSFLVVADDSLNTPRVKDNQIFMANIYIRPLNSINRVVLQFSVVNNQLSFTEAQLLG